MADTINGADRLKIVTEAPIVTDEGSTREMTPDFMAPQVALYDALEDIVEELGQFDQGIGAHGAHYMAENPFAAQGMQCSNCAFYAGPRACEVVSGDIAPEGACKFWIIPEKLLTMPADNEPRDAGATGHLLRDIEARGARVQRREMAVELREVDGGNKLSFSFSSETPVERWFGSEVLSHDPGAADLGRLNDGAPFLWNHDRDAVLGVLESAEISSDRRGYCEIKWSRNAMAKEKRQDVEDRILRNVSFAYSIDDMVERDGVMVVTKWTPLEVSLVSIPADNSVGLDRAMSEGDSMTQAGSAEPSTDSNVPDEETKEAPAATAASPSPQPEPEVPMETTPDVEVIRSTAVEAERNRIASINALGSKFGLADLARELIDGGKDLTEARTAFLEKMEVRSSGQHRIADEKGNDLGLSDKETKAFSFVRALNYLVNPADSKARQAAAFEIEVGEAAARKYERSSNGIVIPNEVLRRDLVVGTSTAGGNLVASDLLSGSFIELLRNRMALMQAGVTMLGGLQGNISIPRQTSSATAYWVGESGSPTESQQAIDQVNMTPKTVGAFVDYSRRLLLQSSIDVEGMIRADLARVIALELDRAAIYGSGSSNQPLGLLNTTGIGTQTITSYGTFAEYIGMETDLGSANADAGTLRYIVNSAARGALKSTEKSATSTAQFVFENNEINGYPAIVSNQLQSNDCLFGDFSQFVVGMWSGLDLTVDPYAGSTAGTVRIIALQDVDFGVRQPAAFCYGT